MIWLVFDALWFMCVRPSLPSYRFPSGSNLRKEQASTSRLQLRHYRTCIYVIPVPVYFSIQLTGGTFSCIGVPNEEFTSN